MGLNINDFGKAYVALKKLGPDNFNESKDYEQFAEELNNIGYFPGHSFSEQQVRGLTRHLYSVIKRIPSSNIPNACKKIIKKMK